jgi:hypothetical protein
MQFNKSWANMWDFLEKQWFLWKLFVERQCRRQIIIIQLWLCSTKPSQTKETYDCNSTLEDDYKSHDNKSTLHLQHLWLTSICFLTMLLNTTVTKTNRFAQLFLQGHINPPPDWRIEEWENITLDKITGHLLHPLAEKCHSMPTKDPHNMANKYVHMRTFASVFL